MLHEKDSEIWFIFQNDSLLLINDIEDPFITNKNVATLLPFLIRQHALGYFNGVNCYSAEINKEIELTKNMMSVSLRKALDIANCQWYNALVKAYMIFNWDKNHQFCGRCGEATVHQSNFYERTCSSCGLLFYPRISPSVIVLIQNEDKILLARSPHFKPGYYGLIAGFVEAGENLEETAHREVKEEVGISIKNLQYYASHPWPFPDSLMIGFIADYAEGDIVVDKKEIEMADWYRFDNLPSRPTSMTIAGKLIDQFVAQAKQKYS